MKTTVPRHLIVLNGKPIHYYKATVTLNEPDEPNIGDVDNKRQLVQPLTYRIAVVRPLYAATDKIEVYTASRGTVERRRSGRLCMRFEGAVLANEQIEVRRTRERISPVDRHECYEYPY